MDPNYVIFPMAKKWYKNQDYRTCKFCGGIFKEWKEIGGMNCYSHEYTCSAPRGSKRTSGCKKNCRKVDHMDKYDQGWYIFSESEMTRIFVKWKRKEKKLPIDKDAIVDQNKEMGFFAIRRDVALDKEKLKEKFAVFLKRESQLIAKDNETV